MIEHDATHDPTRDFDRCTVCREVLGATFRYFDLDERRLETTMEVLRQATDVTWAAP